MVMVAFYLVQRQFMRLTSFPIFGIFARRF
jgi:hypothetical protein